MTKIAMAHFRSLILIGAAGLLALCSETSAQGLRYSLSPAVPFPCRAVSFDGNAIVFRTTMVFVCNGKEQLEMPAGSIMGTNAICSGTALMLSHGISGRGSLFDIVRRCGRTRSRR
jgi:hypothetical protein